ncbi:MAG: hypothetical protein ACRDKT_12585, partial [Actinomycetota bacterium]
MPDERALPLQPDRSEMETIGRASLEYVIGFLEDRWTAPAVDVDGAYEVAASLRKPPPERGRPLGELLDEVDRAARKAYDAAGP